MNMLTRPFAIALTALLLLTLTLSIQPLQANQATMIDLSFTGLTNLGEDYVYEGWVMVDGAPVTAGRFTVDADGNPSETMFAIDSSATAYILTIEPAVGDDPAPSAVHLLAGDIMDGAAMLTIDHPAAINTDFADATGSYILAAPTAPDASYLNGIWWLDPTGADGQVASLDLPMLPEGWAYEGWIAGPDGPISTGTFTSTTDADSDGGGATAGPEPAPLFPGSDFVNPTPIDLTGYRAVISVEPVPDNNPEPFSIKPLVSEPATDPGMGGVLQAMGNNMDGIPSGTATVMTAADEIVIRYTDCNVPQLGGSAFYEGWFIQDGVVLSAGQFTVDENGMLSESIFPISVMDKDADITFVLTIEPAGDTDPGPSDTHLLGGDFVNSMDDSIVATIDHSAALGTDFSTAAGSYILAVPTSTGDDGANYNNGIWFLDTTVNGTPTTPAPSLDLPMLPAGWVYEGWVVVDGMPISTGTFTDPAMADTDGGGATAGANPAPLFPGQDFVTDMLDLVGATIVISVEPAPDDSTTPFVLKPLIDMMVEDTGEPGIAQAMGNNATDLPTCTVEVMAPTATTMTNSVAHDTTLPALLLVSFLIVVTLLSVTRREKLS